MKIQNPFKQLKKKEVIFSIFAFLCFNIFTIFLTIVFIKLYAVFIMDNPDKITVSGLTGFLTYLGSYLLMVILFFTFSGFKYDSDEKEN